MKWDHRGGDTPALSPQACQQLGAGEQDLEEIRWSSREIGCKQRSVVSSRTSVLTWFHLQSRAWDRAFLSRQIIYLGTCQQETEVGELEQVKREGRKVSPRVTIEPGAFCAQVGLGLEKALWEGMKNMTLGGKRWIVTSQVPSGIGLGVPTGCWC